jgi:signal transduction histidine kinase
MATAGQGIWTLKDNRWKKFDNAALPNQNIYAAYTDARGRVWFGYGNGVVTVLDHDAVRMFSNENGIATGAVKVIRGRNENVWIGGELGVAIFQQGRFRMLEAAGPKAFRAVSGILETADGSLWLTESRGVAHVPPTEIHAALHDPAYKVGYELFDYADGLPGPVQQVASPTAVEGTDGRLWFATVGGLVSIAPGKLTKNKLPPGVLVRSVSASGQQYPPGPNVLLPALSNNVQVDYTGLSLSVPDRVLFRYRLDGVDEEWQDAGTRRQAFFNNLSPGHYRFHVVASNNDGVWNEEGAVLDFDIAPAWYQTNWFRLLCVAATLFVLWSLYQLRLRRVAAFYRGRMEERLAERERIARDLHDTLLQSVQGLILKFHAIAQRIPVIEPTRQEIEKALDFADQVLIEGRDRVRHLRTATIGFGELPKAFQRVVEEVAPNRVSSFKTVVEGTVLELHPILREEIYSIGREALINALTHSESRNIEAEIIYESHEFRVRIRDDGIGIDPEVLKKGGRADHWGLQGMRERAERIGADLDVWSRPGSGTEVELRIPAATAYRTSHSKPDSKARLRAAG